MPAFFFTALGVLLFILSHILPIFLMLEKWLHALGVQGGCNMAMVLTWICAVPTIIGGIIAIIAFCRKRLNLWYAFAFAGALPGFFLLAGTIITQLTR